VDAEQLQNYEQEDIYKRIIRILNEEWFFWNQKKSGHK
jgi:hypothetical protein